MILPPDPKEISPSDLWRAFLVPRPRREFTIELSGVGRVRLFVRAIGSAEWVRLHRALVESFEKKNARGEAEYLAALVEDDDGARALSPSDVLSLYEAEQALLFVEASRALRAISPTYASADIGAWLARLKEGAHALENLCDAISFGGCVDVSFGVGRGAVHVREEPETFINIPRRELLDCHWLAYHAARRVVAEINSKRG